MRKAKIETPARIVAAATQLFSSSPYLETSVDQIAAGAGLTKMTVYQYFRSKDQLFLASLRSRLEQRESQLDKFYEGLSLDADPLLAIFNWLETRLAPGRFRGCAFMKALSEISLSIPEVREIALDAEQKIEARLVALAAKSGRDNAAGLGRQLALLFEGAKALAFIEGSARPARVAQEIARSLLDGDNSHARRRESPVHALAGRVNRRRRASQNRNTRQ